MIGREELIGDARFDTKTGAQPARAEVNEIITEWTREHTKEEAMKIIGAAGVPAGAVLDTLELMNDPCSPSAASCRRCSTRHGDGKMPAWPVRFDGTPPELKPSPLLGQHNDEVLGGWLGMGAQEVEALRAEGIIGG